MPTLISEASALPPGKKGAPTSVTNVTGTVQAVYNLIQGENSYGKYSFLKFVLADPTGRIDVLVDTYNPQVVVQGEQVTLQTANVGADKQNPAVRVLRVKEAAILPPRSAGVPPQPAQSAARQDPAWVGGNAPTVAPPAQQAYGKPRPTWEQVWTATGRFFEAADRSVPPDDSPHRVEAVQRHADTLLIAWLRGDFTYDPDAAAVEAAEEVFG